MRQRHQKTGLPHPEVRHPSPHGDHRPGGFKVDRQFQLRFPENRPMKAAGFFLIMILFIIAGASGALAGSGTKITASDGGADDSFGNSVALDGDYAIVGAPYEDAGGGKRRRGLHLSSDRRQHLGCRDQKSRPLTSRVTQFRLFRCAFRRLRDRRLAL
jgi:hypothetical protein